MMEVLAPGYMSVVETAAFDTLPPAEQDALYLAIADLEAKLRARLLTRRNAPQPDRAVGLDEAAERLGMSKAWLSRRANWERVGGYRDHDRRIKFPLTAIQAHIQGRR